MIGTAPLAVNNECFLAELVIAAPFIMQVVLPYDLEREWPESA
jgi:hypothetical protein